MLNLEEFLRLPAVDPLAGLMTFVDVCSVVHPYCPVTQLILDEPLFYL